MQQLSLSYADARSGDNATSIGWINFGNIYLEPGESITGLYVKLFDGSILSFDLKNDSNINTGFALQSAPVPLTPTSNFGVSSYTSIPGNVSLVKSALPTSVEGDDSSLFTLYNITFLSSSGTLISNFTLNIADLYSLTSGNPALDFQQYITNGTQWSELELVGTGPAPVIDITDESSVPITPLSLGNQIMPFALGDPISVADITYTTSDTSSPILDTESPSFIQAHLIAANADPAQGFTIGLSAPNPNTIIRSRGVNLFR